MRFPFSVYHYFLIQQSEIKIFKKANFDSYYKKNIIVTKPTLQSNLDLNNVAPMELVLS